MASLLRPQSIEEAVDLIGKHGTSMMILAGGTSLLQSIHPSDDGYLMSIDRLNIDTVLQREGSWSVGAGVSISSLRSAVSLPVILSATREVGGPAIQNMATVGGNFFGKEPFGDIAVALLALDAQLNFVGPTGEKTRSITNFYSKWVDGTPPQGELLTRIDIPKPPGALAYRKCARRRFGSPSVVTVAVQITKENNLVTKSRIALSGASPHPFCCTEAEAALIGSSLDADAIRRASQAAETAVSPKTDPVASDWYRQRMASVYVRRVLEELAHF